VRLRDLVAAPELGIRLLHGDDTVLDRPLRWVCTTDLLDPAPYLSGGELVVSGLMWRRTPADSETFVATLARAGAAALAAGDAVFGCVPDDLVDACRRHGLPLVGVPTEVAFGDVTEYVVGAVSAERGARLAASLARQRQLLALVAEGRSLDELTARVSADTGLVCRVLTPTGREVGAGPEPLATDEVDRLTHAFLAAERLPVVTRGSSSTYSLFAVGPGLGHRTASWMVVAEGVWSEWPPEVADAVSELASIAALDRARRDEGLRVSRQVAEDALNLVLGGASGRPETTTRLRQAGLDVDAPLLVVVAAFVDRDDLVETARAILDDLVAGVDGSMVAAVTDGAAVAVLPLADVDAVRRALGRLAPGVAGTRLGVGIGGPAPSSAIGGALDEARHAHRLARLRSGPVTVVSSDEITSSVLLLATVPDDARRAFAARVLSAVLDYDAAHQAGLRETLEAFLDCSGSWSRTAQRLHLHVNTVRYRIGRVEELTGRDLSRLEDRVDVFLALRSL
jgi:DNA-binding PucR family transcriptional regulator